MFSSEERKYQRMHAGDMDELTPQAYNLVLGLSIFYGIAMNVVMVMTCHDFAMRLNPMFVLIGYFASALIGVLLAQSKSSLLSFVGYNLIVVPIGIVLAISIPGYAMEDIMLSIGLVGIIVILMIATSAAYPTFFSNLGGALGLSLLITIIVELISFFLGYNGTMIDYVVVLIFMLYVGYDWHRAQSYPKTVDNAIDSAIDIYLDIINLFIRILSILSKREK